MGFFGCGAMIQFSVIAIVTVGMGCSFLAWYADLLWAEELQRIKVVFTDEEAHILQRNGHLWDLPYLLVLLSLYGLSIVHTFLCFKKQHHRFHKSKLSLIMTLTVGLGLIGVSICPIITAWVYDAQYTEVQKKDHREYTYQSQLANGSVYYVKTNSIFHYCHFGNGRPIHWSKLKGIRMKKYASNLCQKAGLRYISAFLTAYAGGLYLFTLKVLDSRHRDKSAAHIALLFDLFGDLEESIAENTATMDRDGEEHFGVQMDLQIYKRSLLQSSFEKTRLPPKLQEWLRTGKYDEEDDDTYDRQVIEPNKYRVSPYADENTAKGVPDYLTKIMETRLEIKGEAEAREKAEQEAEEALEEKREAWLEARKQRLRTKRLRYADTEPI